MLTKNDEDTIDKLLAATSNGDISPLFEALGGESQEAAHFGRESIAEIIHEGKRWWASNEAQARAAVCGSKTVQRLSESDDTKEIALVMATTLGTLFGATTAVIVAVLVLRLGIKEWCRSTWGQEKAESS